MYGMMGMGMGMMGMGMGMGGMGMYGRTSILLAFVLLTTTVDDCCRMLRLLPQDGDAWNGDDGGWYGCAHTLP